jgi:hypothetical protein
MPLMRRICLWLGLLCLGCHVLPGFEVGQEDPPLASAVKAQQDKPSEAVIPATGSDVTEDPELKQNHLGIAAAFLQKRNYKDACIHLADFLDAHPDALLVRVRYAELLTREHRLAEARRQFERFIEDAQDLGGPAASRMINCHGQLVAIAEETEDAYEEHLHRGIGLYLLARKRLTLPDPEDELPAQGLLCKAAAELTLAQVEHPCEARPCWYLYTIWSQLGQGHPALCQLRQAHVNAPFTYLTPAEERTLQAAYQTFLYQLRGL